MLKIVKDFQIAGLWKTVSAEKHAKIGPLTFIRWTILKKRQTSDLNESQFRDDKLIIIQKLFEKIQHFAFFSCTIQ